MPTRRARSRSDSDASPPSRAISHAASRISALVASRRSCRRSLVVLLNTVRNYEQCSENIVKQRPMSSAWMGGRSWRTHPSSPWRPPCRSSTESRPVPPAGSTSCPRTPTRAVPSTATSSAGPPRQGGEEYGGYINFFKDGAQVAGLMAKQPEMGEMPDVWSIYLVGGGRRRGRRGRPGQRRRGARWRRWTWSTSAAWPSSPTPVARHRRVAAEGVQELPARLRGRHPGLVRAAHPRLRQDDRLLRDRLRVDHPGRGRHATSSATRR